MDEIYNNNGNTKKNVWKNIENCKKYAKILGEKLGYTTAEHWYNITNKIIESNKGSGLIKNYNNSPILFVKTVVKLIYVDYEWLEWKFKCVPQNYWDDIDNHKIYAIWLGNVLGYTEPEQWYNISKNKIVDNHGSGMLIKHDNSPILFVKTVVKLIYVDYEWLEWKFQRVPQNYWDDINNHKIYAEWLGNKLGYSKPEDWYNITGQMIKDNFGNGLIQIYKGSSIQFLRTVFPHYHLVEWKFGMSSLGIWKDINNHKKYAEWLGNELGYTEAAHWYNITVQIINDKYGRSLLTSCYRDSPIRFVKTVVKLIYTDYEWLEWKFNQTYRYFWNELENCNKYIKWLGNELGYTKPQDWYNITSFTIENNHGCSLLKRYSIIEIAYNAFPEYEWDENKFCKNKTEKKLYDILIIIYPTLVRQFKEEWCKNKTYLPFDFCIPELKIIIELDGPQHFQQVSNWSSPEEQFENDKYKEKCANDNEYSVIRILQEDVLNDRYDWLKDLCNTIEEIKNGDEVVNAYLCKNGEYECF
jgi:very-short-patch-repair endonuclease